VSIIGLRGSLSSPLLQKGGGGVNCRAVAYRGGSCARDSKPRELRSASRRSARGAFLLGGPQT